MKNFLQKIHNYWVEDISFYALLVIMVFTIFLLPPMMEYNITGAWLLRILLLVFFLYWHMVYQKQVIEKFERRSFSRFIDHKNRRVYFSRT